MYSQTLLIFYYNYIRKQPSTNNSKSIIDFFNSNYYCIKFFEIQEL